MNAASATINATPYSSWKYPVLFVQDDWRVRSNLTLNLGFRWDYESPVTERYNRQTRGFDYYSPSPIQVKGLSLRGGLLFAGQDGVPAGEFNSNYFNFQPRFGYAWRPFGGRRVVMRGGVGRSFLPTTDIGNASAYSETTNAEVSTVEGLSLRVLSNPFPSGLIQPPGAGRGLATLAGDNISFNDPGRHVPYVYQYSTGIQVEMPRGVLIEANYSGSQTRWLPVSRNINALSVSQLALGTAYLNTGVPNPFYGVLPPSTPRGTSSSMQRRVLLLPYPQFGTITENDISIGSQWYNSAQLKLQKRFQHGFSLLVTYVNSKNMTAIAFLNPEDTKLSRELAAYDIPQRLVFSGLLEPLSAATRSWADGR